jgi:hypothetical protein
MNEPGRQDRMLDPTTMPPYPGAPAVRVIAIPRLAARHPRGSVPPGETGDLDLG